MKRPTPDLRILIDPPVGPYHPRAEIEAWIDDLEGRLAAEDKPENRAAYEEALVTARWWLKAQESWEGFRAGSTEEPTVGAWEPDEEDDDAPEPWELPE